MKNFTEKLILALDVSSSQEALKRVDQCLSLVKTFKVGSQLFTEEGPQVVREIQNQGGKVFLDLKFHDIPNTVVRAVEAATELGVFMLNLHILGGIKMMSMAKKEVEKASGKKVRPLIVGVTLLTSLENEDLKDLNISGDTKELVLRYAGHAKKAGLDGVVCSVHEVSEIKKKIGKDFMTVTPGIRFSNERSLEDDQKRFSGIEEALQVETDFMVLGRSLFQHPKPLELLRQTIETYSHA